MFVELHPIALSQALVLIAVANSSPIFARKILGDSWAAPLDCGLVLMDGQPLFGSSKTIRGIVVAVLSSTLAAMLLGLDAMTGALAGIAAMSGDLCSSFIKRRLKRLPSSMAPGLDQVPESLAPLAACTPRLDLSLSDIVVGVALFWIGALLLSRWLYRLKIRDRPY